MNAREKKAEYDKEYRENNKEKQAEYMREWKKNNREKQALTGKKYYQKNREKIVEQKKEYRLKNKEAIAERAKERRKTDKSKKCSRISYWKHKGLICDDYEKLYDDYLLSTNCENCDVEFDKDVGMNKRCMDHDHKTGLFRNFLCCSCNLKRF